MLTIWQCLLTNHRWCTLYKPCCIPLNKPPNPPERGRRSCAPRWISHRMDYVMRGSGSTSAANPGRQGSWRLVASKPAPLPVNELFWIWLRDLKRHFVDLVKPVTLLPRVYQSCCRSRRSPWEIVYLPKTAKVKLGSVTNAILKSKSKLLIS